MACFRSMPSSISSSSSCVESGLDTFWLASTLCTHTTPFHNETEDLFCYRTLVVTTLGVPHNTYVSCIYTFYIYNPSSGMRCIATTSVPVPRHLTTTPSRPEKHAHLVKRCCKIFYFVSKLRADRKAEACNRKQKRNLVLLRYPTCSIEGGSCLAREVSKQLGGHVAVEGVHIFHGCQCAPQQSCAVGCGLSSCGVHAHPCSHVLVDPNGHRPKLCSVFSVPV